MPGDAPWWAERPLDWTRPEPKRTRDLLQVAYATTAELARLAQAAGLPAVDASPSVDPWTALIEGAALGGRIFALSDAVLADDRAQPFHQALERLVHADAGLQTINVPTLGLLDPEMSEQVTRNARRRTAMIVRGGQPVGTGFLVGPDLLLTAAHVIDHRNTPPAPGTPVEACFDFLPRPDRAPAEAGTRVPVIELGIAGSLPTDSEIRNDASDWNATDTHLDFTLMRLARDVSVDQEANLPRGFFPLETDPFGFSTAELLLIVQHPIGQTQKMSWVLGPFRVNTNGTRVRYRCNTLPGSSGSAVLDVRGRLVALHHYAASGLNQGVTIDKVARNVAVVLPLPRAAVANEVATPTTTTSPSASAPGSSPFDTLHFGREPFVDRVDLRATVRAMLSANDRRILLLEGGQDAGKTYAHRYLTHLSARAEHPSVRALVKGLRVAHVDLDRYVDVPPAELQARILGNVTTALGLVRDPTLAQPVRHVTDLVALLEALAPDAPVRWIFFDSLDRHQLEHGQVNELIAALLRLVGGNEAIPVRLVLSTRPPSPVPPDLLTWAERDVAQGLRREHVEDWLRESALRDHHTLDAARLAAKLDELFPGGAAPSARALAPKLPRALEELLGDAT